MHDLLVYFHKQSIQKCSYSVPFKSKYDIDKYIPKYTFSLSLRSTIFKEVLNFPFLIQFMLWKKCPCNANLQIHLSFAFFQQWLHPFPPTTSEALLNLEHSAGKHMVHYGMGSPMFPHSLSVSTFSDSFLCALWHFITTHLLCSIGQSHYKFPPITTSLLCGSVKKKTLTKYLKHWLDICPKVFNNAAKKAGRIV